MKYTDVGDDNGAEGRPSVLSLLQESEESTFEVPSEIRDQIYDDKANTVTITVVCCDPERLRDKLCRKGGGSIKSIEIKPPPKPKEPQKPKEPEKQPVKPKEPEKKPEKPKEPEKKPEKPKEPEKKPEKPKEPEKKPEKPKESTPKPPAKPASPPPQRPACPPVGFCWTECYHGHCGSPPPCYFGGPPPPPCYSYGRPVYENWGGGGGYRYHCASRGDCFSDENPQACSVM
ncbi:hypothetical protein V6N12_070988 [Hibiscus sabdariffa]|uniref:Uncharacterized protein n=1 Tax=Hibiscus sabdariffa TaxID=183260 RepID=A0ABR2FIL6_9ROSI